MLIADVAGYLTCACCVYVLLAYWEKRETEAGAILGPWGPYHSAQSEKPVNESSERMGQ